MKKIVAALLQRYKAHRIERRLEEIDHSIEYSEDQIRHQRNHLRELFAEQDELESELTLLQLPGLRSALERGLVVAARHNGA
jgi:hypothetical protein